MIFTAVSPEVRPSYWQHGQGYNPCDMTRRFQLRCIIRLSQKHNSQHKRWTCIHYFQESRATRWELSPSAIYRTYKTKWKWAWRFFLDLGVCDKMCSTCELLPTQIYSWNIMKRVRDGQHPSLPFHGLFYRWVSKSLTGTARRFHMNRHCSDHNACWSIHFFVLIGVCSPVC